MLYDKLKNNNRIPFHMPGHKRNTKLLGNNFPYDIDITEIENFDNLHNPIGIIKTIEMKISKLYNSDKSFILVNGSTCGILSAIYTLASEGDEVLIGRNSHKSVYNALKIIKAKTKYINPELDEYGIHKAITLEAIKPKISHNTKLIVLTSPTYEGVISEIDDICDYAHSRNIPVLVDSAHGAHYFSKSKADIVIMSLHKTLPALTQCAVAHLNGNLVDHKQFQISLSMFETSSPSYVFISSVEKCIDFIFENKEAFDFHNEIVADFNNITSELKNLKVVKYEDNCKIIVYTGYSNINGNLLSNLLRAKYNIEIEMVSKDYILAITTVCDTKENLDIFAQALLEIDKTLQRCDNSQITQLELPKKVSESYEINKAESVKIDDSENMISCEYVWAYPPGIPLIVPGEIINKEFIKYVKNNINEEINIQSTYGELPQRIYCTK